MIINYHHQVIQKFNKSTFDCSQYKHSHHHQDDYHETANRQYTHHHVQQNFVIIFITINMISVTRPSTLGKKASNVENVEKLLQIGLLCRNTMYQTMRYFFQVFKEKT